MQYVLPARLRRSRIALAGTAILLFWALVALFAPVISPWPPNEIDFTAMGDRGFSRSHLLGTDATGRDMLSRLIWGARTTYLVVPLSIGSAFLLGGLTGLLAGWYGGWIDVAVSRIGDVMLSFPALVLYIILITAFRPSLLNIVIAVTLAYPTFFR